MRHKRHQIITEDGSSTLRIDDLKETYHSRHGAILESDFVYLKEGLKFWLDQHPNQSCRILELGYGTGLMTYLTYLKAQKEKLEIEYVSLEAFPLTSAEIHTLNYEQFFQNDAVSHLFSTFNQLPWEQKEALTSHFNLTKKEIKFEDFTSEFSFDLIFYDAFGFHAQPELWSEQCMSRCYELLSPKGVWVSYCAKGSVRRGLEKAGFETFRLPGPPGKREMLRAVKH